MTNEDNYTSEGLPKISPDVIGTLGRDLLRMIEEKSTEARFSDWRKEIKEENPDLYNFMIITTSQPISSLDQLTAMYKLLKAQAQCNQLENDSE